MTSPRLGQPLPRKSKCCRYEYHVLRAWADAETGDAGDAGAWRMRFIKRLTFLEHFELLVGRSDLFSPVDSGQKVDYSTFSCRKRRLKQTFLKREFQESDLGSPNKETPSCHFLHSVCCRHSKEQRMLVGAKDEVENGRASRWVCAPTNIWAAEAETQLGNATHLLIYATWLHPGCLGAD